MNIATLTPILSDTLRAATPLVLAALGELVTEKAGVLNLGVEGIMLLGAVSGLIAAFITGNLFLGLIASIVSGMALVILVWRFLRSSRAGLVLRSIGESPESADALALPVIGMRYLAVLFGGALAGLAGAYLSLVYTPLWAENMISGRGWIAITLVVFATWEPERILLGAYLFGGVSAIGLVLQAMGVDISPYLLSSLPYLATILVLVLISKDEKRTHLGAPASLGQPFRPSP